MKSVSLRTAEGKSRDYLLAVHKFFKDIPEIVSIDGTYFMGDTKNHVYFYIEEIVHERYTFTANVLVRKKSLSVDFYNEVTGEVSTAQYLELFKKDSYCGENNAWD